MSITSLNSNTVSVSYNDKEVAYFTMHANPYSVTIDYSDCGGVELAKNMIRILCEKMDLAPETLIYVDADASNGFWESVGFKPNRYYDSKRTEGNGYELVIEFEKLLAWAKA